MPNVNIYLPDDLAAELEGVKDRLNVSAICQRALREELSIVQAVDAGEDMERIKVDLEDTNGILRTAVFTGRWLLEPKGDEVDSGVALTKHGRIAIWSSVRGGLSELLDFDDLDRAEATGQYPSVVIADARAVLTDTTPVVELDI